MHVILGAGGPVANALNIELLNNNNKVRLVSRSEIKTANENASWQKADLLNYQELFSATKEATVIYLCAGLVYDAAVWQQQWPIIIKNVINVAKAHNARLIFFDNIYMYGLVNGPITENTPYNPCSKKGEVRAKIATELMNEVNAGNLQASIARAADFYGTDSKNSFLDMMVFDKYAKNQTAQWLGKTNVLHNFTFIKDAGKSVFLLGQKPESDNQIWHIPTSPPLKGIDFINLSAQIYEVKPKYFKINKFMLTALGLFNKVIAGSVEMYYQYDQDYNFNSTKFEQAFNFSPTSYRDGISEMAKTNYKKK